MKLISLSDDQWEKYRRPLLQFVKRYDSCQKRSTHKWLFHLKGQNLTQPGTSIQLALWEGKIVAVAAVSDYGTTYSSILVSPRYAHTQIQTRLFISLLDELGVCYTKIRYDQEQKIKVALEAGLVCFAYVEGTDGDAYLWFGGGHWDTRDVIEQEA